MTMTTALAILKQNRGKRLQRSVTKLKQSHPSTSHLSLAVFFFLKMG